MVDACYFCQRPLGSVFTYHWGNPCHSECVPMDEKDRRIAALRAELEQVKRENERLTPLAVAYDYLEAPAAEAAERLAGARVEEATRHAVELEQCAIFAADVGDSIAKAMTDAAQFLRALASHPCGPSPVVSHETANVVDKPAGARVKVLRGINDKQVDAAAEVIWNDRDGRLGGPWDGRAANEIAVIQTKATARAALEAALAEPAGEVEAVAWCRKWNFRGRPCEDEFTNSAALAEQWRTHPQTNEVIALYPAPPDASAIRGDPIREAARILYDGYDHMGSLPRAAHDYAYSGHFFSALRVLFDDDFAGAKP